MRTVYIRKLVFSLIQNDSLVQEATGWEYDDIEKDNTFTFPRLPKNEEEFEANFSKYLPLHEYYEFAAVHAVFKSLSLLSTDSLCKKIGPQKGTFSPTELVSSDFSFSVRKTYWEPSEAILISLGLKPEEGLQQIYSDLDDRSLGVCGLLRAYRDRLKLFYAARKSGHLLNGWNPIEILEWLIRMEFSIPVSLPDAVHKYQGLPPLNNNNVDKMELSGLEKQTLLKLIAAMAIRGYSFNPASSRNTATKDIQSDLDFLGLSLDQKTILKWLREATKNLPDET